MSRPRSPRAIRASRSRRNALGDVLFDGIAQNAYKQNVAYALQSDAAYKLTDTHTLRAGLFAQSDRSKSLTDSSVIALGPDGNQISDVPVSIADDGAKTEWIESVYPAG